MIEFSVWDIAVYDDEGDVDLNAVVEPYLAAIEQMHRELHPDQGLRVSLCVEEPCRALAEYEAGRGSPPTWVVAGLR